MSTGTPETATAAVADSANSQAERLRSLLAEAQRAAADRDAERVARIARRWRGRA